MRKIINKGGIKKMKNEKVKEWINDYLENHLEFFSLYKTEELLKDYSNYLIQAIKNYVIEQLENSIDYGNDV
jgi:hypothetical protein